MAAAEIASECTARRAGPLQHERTAPLPVNPQAQGAGFTRPSIT